MQKLFTRILFTLFFLSLFLIAEEPKNPATETAPQPTRTTVSDLLPPQEILFINYIFQPDNDISKQDVLRRDEYRVTFDMHEYRMGFTPMFPLADNIYGGLGATYTAYNLRFDAPEGTENRSLHAVSFPVTLAYIGDDWMFVGQVVPGMKSDFRGFNRHDAQVNGSVMVGYLFHPQFLLQLGLALANDFGDLAPIPLIGIEWKILPPYLDLSMVIPFYARINLHPMENNPERFTMFLFYELDGDQFRFRYRDDVGQVREEDGQFTFYRIGVGVEYFPTPGLGLKLVVGGTAEGEYEFRGLSIKDDGRIDESFFMMLSISIDENMFKSSNL